MDGAVGVAWVAAAETAALRGLGNAPRQNLQFSSCHFPRIPAFSRIFPHSTGKKILQLAREPAIGHVGFLDRFQFAMH
jgi:hypothetical protein